MKINRDSWHYKFMDWMEGHPESKNNVCKYVRGLLFNMILAVFFASLGLAMLLSVVFILAYPLFDNDIGVSLLSGIAWVLIGWLAIVIIRENDLDNSRIIYEKKYKPVNSEPTLLGSWWQSFKDKTCIKVDFE